MWRYKNWIAWTALSVIMTLALIWKLQYSEDKSFFLVGTTSAGHHQLELACATCHTSPFGGTEILQEACEGCHQEELKAVRDSHPKRKFTDPANADRIAVLDARFCITCHREHQEDITNAMGVTVPNDVCFKCHADVGEERASHAGLPFESCGSSGCHNFHDNTALYESFLVEHAGEPWVKESPLVAPLTVVEAKIGITLTSPESEATVIATGNLALPITADAPPDQQTPTIVSAWQTSGHADALVNCNDCHQQNANWVADPDISICANCHDKQNTGFLAGKHGMRLAANLPAMTPALARIEMHESVSHVELDCNACHTPHEVKRSIAAVSACTSCHNSEHVNEYKGSKHESLFAASMRGELPEEAGVSCATCHMPRISERSGGKLITHVEHNQNANLRPSDKMLRSVCMNCHSLEFSMDALADEALVRLNFKGLPSVHVPSTDMAIDRRSTTTNRDTTYD